MHQTKHNCGTHDEQQNPDSPFDGSDGCFFYEVFAKGGPEKSKDNSDCQQHVSLCQSCFQMTLCTGQCTDTEKISGQPGHINGNSHRVGSSDKLFFGQSGFGEKGCPESSLMSGNTPEKTAQHTAKRKIPRGNLPLIETRIQIEPGKKDHEATDNKLHRTYCEVPPSQRIGENGGEV